MGVRTTCFVVLGLRRDAILLSTRNSQQQQEHTSRAETLAAAAAAAQVATTLVVRIATTTPGLGQLRRLTETGDASRGHLSSDDNNSLLVLVGCSACS